MIIVVRVIDQDKTKCEAELKRLSQLLQAQGYKETKTDYAFQGVETKNWLVAREFSRE